MKKLALIIIFCALALPVSASTVVSWTQEDISGYNLTLNYTSEFNVVRDNLLGITIENIGNETLNDSITINEIKVTTSEAQGNWTGSLLLKPNSSQTINFVLNITSDHDKDVDIKIYYNVSSDDKTLNVEAHFSGAPEITSWSNNKTNNSDLSLKINETENVKFNFTANQTLTSWHWTLNGATISNPSDTLSRTFNNDGSFKLNASGSNTNGSTQVITWNITVLEKESKKRNATIITWSPQVVDYIYVNESVNETIEYSLTTNEIMTEYNWTVDGRPVTGYADDNMYSYDHTWDNASVGFHTVIFKGSNADTKVDFRWYINVYKIGGYEGGDLFEVIDNALENHVSDIKIRMFKYKIAKNGKEKSVIIAQKVNQLHDEIAKRQMTREALREEFRAGNITIEQYVLALKQVQRDTKSNSKLAKGYAKYAIEDLKDAKSQIEFETISEADSDKKNNKKNDNIERASDGKDKGKYTENSINNEKNNGNDKQKENKKNGNGKK